MGILWTMTSSPLPRPTPARDALAIKMPGALSTRTTWINDAINVMLSNPDLVIAAVIETGWRPDAEQLRILRGDD